MDMLSRYSVVETELENGITCNTILKFKITAQAPGMKEADTTIRHRLLKNDQFFPSKVVTQLVPTSALNSI